MASGWRNRLEQAGIGYASEQSRQFLTPIPWIPTSRATATVEFGLDPDGQCARRRRHPSKMVWWTRSTHPILWGESGLGYGATAGVHRRTHRPLAGSIRAVAAGCLSSSCGSAIRDLQFDDVRPAIRRVETLQLDGSRLTIRRCLTFRSTGVTSTVGWPRPWRTRPRYSFMVRASAGRPLSPRSCALRRNCPGGTPGHRGLEAPKHAGPSTPTSASTTMWCAAGPRLIPWASSRPYPSASSSTKFSVSQGCSPP